MQPQDYVARYAVDQSPAQVFEAITDARGWWSQVIEGRTDEVGAVFYYEAEGLHRCVIKVAELVPGKRVVWDVLFNEFTFVKDRNEWTGTRIVFEISPQGLRTELNFTHVGLVPTEECYEVCANAWGTYIRGSLRELIAKGSGTPNTKDRIVAARPAGP